MIFGLEIENSNRRNGTDYRLNVQSWNRFDQYGQAVFFLKSVIRNQHPFHSFLQGGVTEHL